MKYRLGACALVLALAACSRGDGVAESGLANGNAARQPAGLLIKQAQPVARVSIASAPDRGVLISYPDHGKPARREGAHTWYPAKISEAHAFNAIASGEMTLPLPDGSELKLKHERHPEGSDGNWTWIGRVEGGDPGQEAIITFGDDAVYGSIPQADGKPPLEIRTQGGSLWVVQADPSLLRKPNIGDRDMKLPPSRSTRQSAAAHASTKSSAAALPMAAAAAAGTTVDVVIGYTSGFRTARGGQSQAVTRLNYLVEVGNQAYSNSGVSGQLRLVGTVEVNYADNTDNETALEQLTGNSGSGSVTVPASLKPIRDAREQYGADIAVLVRKFQTPENDGCGIAWLNGGNGTTIDPALDDDFGFGVVSDGTDPGTDGKTYFCADETLVHEASHLMGSAHDVDNAGGTQGAFPYSYGYKSSASNGNFYTVMAYGDSGQTPYRAFSNPSITFCGGRPCGVTNQSDNARSLNQTMPVVANFRSSVVEDAVMPLRSLDANGDGQNDLLFFIHAENRFVIWYMKSGSRIGTSSIPMDGDLAFLDGGDLNGDGADDLVFVDEATSQITVAMRSGGGFQISVLPFTFASGYTPVAVADMNGEGKADIVFWNPETGKMAIWYMSGATRVSSNNYLIASGYRFVGAGDVNIDGKTDIIWTNESRKIILTVSRGLTFDNYLLGYIYKESSVLSGFHDVSGDGRADLIFVQSDNSRVMAWHMNGRYRTKSTSTPTDSGYRLVGKGKYNSDKYGDLVFVNPDNSKIRYANYNGSNFTFQNLSLVPKSTSSLMDAY